MMVRHENTGPDPVLLIAAGVILLLLGLLVIMAPIWAGWYFRAPVWSGI